MSQCGEKPSIRIAKIRENLENAQGEKALYGEIDGEGVVNASGKGIRSIGSSLPTAAFLPMKYMVDVLGNVETMPQQGGNLNIGGEGGFIGGTTNESETNGSGDLIYEPNTTIGIGKQDVAITPDGIYENPNLLENAPSFKVPANPLLPPEYKEVLNYNDIQFLNGFIRTQIGRYIRVECLVGSNNIEIRAGYLIGVGLNYILLQESITGNVISVDFWSIKFVYYYYNEEEAERALAFGPLLNSPVR